MGCYYCLHCLRKIETRKEERAGKVQCRSCGRRRTVACETLRAGVKRIESLPIPIKELGTIDEPLEGIERFPIMKVLLESDARLKEPLCYLSTRVGLIYEKWKEMSPSSSLNGNLFEKAVQEARKELKKKEKNLS